MTSNTIRSIIPSLITSSTPVADSQCLTPDTCSDRLPCSWLDTKTRNFRASTCSALIYPNEDSLRVDREVLFDREISSRQILSTRAKSLRHGLLMLMPCSFPGIAGFIHNDPGGSVTCPAPKLVSDDEATITRMSLCIAVKECTSNTI